MAWATKCDRCGKYFDWTQGATNGFTPLEYDLPHDKYNIDGDEYDLCPECVDSLWEWFTAGKVSGHK